MFTTQLLGESWRIGTKLSENDKTIQPISPHHQKLEQKIFYESRMTKIMFPNL